MSKLTEKIEHIEKCFEKADYILGEVAGSINDLPEYLKDWFEIQWKDYCIMKANHQQKEAQEKAP